MSNALRKPMTLDEFLAWEERQELRYEFDGFQPVAMTGGTFAHDAVSINLAVVVGGVRPVLTAVREESAPVELRGLDEVQQRVVIVLGLARVTDNEVAPERGVRLPDADVGYTLEESIPVAPPAHPSQ